MTTESIRVSGVVPVAPERVYEAFLVASEHAAMTGGKATVDRAVGGAFTAWDGYIWGRNLELEPARRIVQSWRTSEFPAEAPDSHLVIELDAVEGGTRITFVHSEIPEGQGDNYRDGWRSFYLEPMARYFEQASRPTQVLDADSIDELWTDASPRPLAKAEPAVSAAPARKAKAKAKPKKAAAKKTAAKAKAKAKAKPAKAKAMPKAKPAKGKAKAKAKPAKAKAKPAKAAPKAKAKAKVKKAAKKQVKKAAGAKKGAAKKGAAKKGAAKKGAAKKTKKAARKK